MQLQTSSNNDICLNASHTRKIQCGITRLIGAVSIALLAVGLALYTKPAFAAENLSLDQFLNQVATGNDELKGHVSGTEAGELRSKEYKLLYMPTLIAEYENYRDRRLTNAPSFQGSETRYDNYKLGIQQNLGIGIDTKLYYQYTDNRIIGTNPAFFPQPNFIVTSPVLEINASLWRNLFGSEVRAQKELSSGKALALRYNSEYGQAQLKAMAESAYWRLATARKLLAASKENLLRAEKIQSWSAKRSKLALSDKSDFLQSNATLAARRIELQAAIDEEKSAALEFNNYRGRTETTVPEQLVELSTEKISELPLPKKEGQRQDIKAAEQQAVVAKASAKLSEEVAKPRIEAYARLSRNGRDPDDSTAIDQSFTGDYPWNTVGIKMSIPISLGVASDTRQGYRAEARSAEQAYQFKAFKAEKDWMDLKQKFEDAKKRLTLAYEMEKAQKAKMEYERTRFTKGRTTTYQVILFEQDYTTAQVSRLNLEKEILNLYAQLKTYGGNS